MGNTGTRETEREQKKRKCKFDNTLSAMKGSPRNKCKQDKIRANCQRQLKKLNMDIEKAIEGNLNGDVLQCPCDIIAKILRQTDDLTKDVNKCKEQERKKKAQYDYICNEKEQMVARIRNLETQLEQVRNEKRLLQSEIGAMCLNENNSDITDLSNVNCSFNLVEEFSNLYGEMWMDTFHILQEQMQMNETESIHLLLKCVQMVFEICREHARSQYLYLQDAILKYTGLNEQNRNETVVTEAVKIVRGYRQKNFMYSMEKISKYVQIKLQEELSEKTVQQIASFTKESTHICWLMNIQDPPMFLSFGQYRNIGEEGPCTFDNTCFAYYTSTGMYVDFVVWPALYLCEGGPLLMKGVAQATSNPPVVAKTATANATEKSGHCYGKHDSSRCGGDTPSLFKRVTVKFLHEKQKCRPQECEGNKMKNLKDEEEKIQNGATNTRQNMKHANPTTINPWSSKSVIPGINNISLSRNANISQMTNYHSDMTDVGS